MGVKGAVSSIGPLVIASMLIALTALGFFASGISNFTDFVSQNDRQKVNELRDTVQQKCDGKLGTGTSTNIELEFENLNSLSISSSGGSSVISAQLGNEKIEKSVENCEVSMEGGPVNKGKWAFDISCESGCGGDETSSVNVKASEVG